MLDSARGLVLDCLSWSDEERVVAGIKHVVLSAEVDVVVEKDQVTISSSSMTVMKSFLATSFLFSAAVAWPYEVPPRQTAVPTRVQERAEPIVAAIIPTASGQIGINPVLVNPVFVTLSLTLHLLSGPLYLIFNILFQSEMCCQC